MSSKPRYRDSCHPARAARIIAFALEVGFIIALLALWFGSASIRQSKHLVVLFLYCFPSQFAIAILPFEPVLLYFSRYWPALTITAVAIAGTLITELLNYVVFRFIADLKPSQKVIGSRWVTKLIALFNRAPFVALVIAGFTPVPFYPFRLLVVLARYPIRKYLFAVFLGRAPRFYLLAILGYALNVPTHILFGAFLAITLILYLPVIIRLIRRRRTPASPEQTPSAATESCSLEQTEPHVPGKSGS